MSTLHLPAPIVAITYGDGQRVASVVEREVPVLVAVPWGNLDGWRRFAGDLAVEYELENVSPSKTILCRHLGLIGDGDDANATTRRTSGKPSVVVEVG